MARAPASIQQTLTARDVLALLQMASAWMMTAPVSDDHLPPLASVLSRATLRLAPWIPAKGVETMSAGWPDTTGVMTMNCCSPNTSGCTAPGSLDTHLRYAA